ATLRAMAKVPPGGRLGTATVSRTRSPGLLAEELRRSEERRGGKEWGPWGAATQETGDDEPGGPLGGRGGRPRRAGADLGAAATENGTLALSLSRLLWPAVPLTSAQAQR